MPVRPKLKLEPTQTAVKLDVAVPGVGGAVQALLVNTIFMFGRCLYPVTVPFRVVPVEEATPTILSANPSVYSHLKASVAAPLPPIVHSKAISKDPPV